MKVFSVSIAMLAIVGISNAQSLRAQITAADAKIVAAMKKKDIKALEKIMRATLTSDFKYVENGQTEDFEAMFTTLKMGIAQMSKITTAEAKIVTLSRQGNVAEGTTRHKMVGFTMGPDKKRHVLAFMGLAKDTYKNESGIWKFSTMEWATQSMTMDGKPMPSGAK